MQKPEIENPLCASPRSALRLRASVGGEEILQNPLNFLQLPSEKMVGAFHPVYLFGLGKRVIELGNLGDRAEFIVFGVVTEYCVGCAVKGLLERKRRVAIVKDAIETLSPETGANTLAEFQRLGARVVTTDEALAQLES